MDGATTSSPVSVQATTSNRVPEKDREKATDQLKHFVVLQMTQNASAQVSLYPCE